MPDPDESLEALRRIKEEFANFCNLHGMVTEADTRAKVIDRVLQEVCGWPETAFRREEHVTRGYIDYVLSIPGRRLIAVEAKREGLPFLMPAGRARTLKLSGTLLTDTSVKEAILQVRGYCDDAAIRYAVATNGYAWIIFRALREDTPWREGTAFIFRSFDDIAENFTAFWNLLGYSAVTEGRLDAEFSPTARPTRELHRVIDRLFNADLPLQRNRYHAQLDPLIKTIFENIADQHQTEILQRCYVHSASLRIVAEDLDVTITDSIPRFLRAQGTEPILQGQDNAGRFGEAISHALELPRGELFSASRWNRFR